jgi:hypothetical protein
VEAAWIMGIFLSILCTGILFGYQIYSQTADYVSTWDSDMNAVTLFRQKDTAEQWKAVLEGVR